MAVDALEHDNIGGQIYREGRGHDPITGRLDSAKLRLGGGSVPCAGCHGVDGLGLRESSVRAPPIAAWALARRGDRGNRTRRPYDRRLLARAITEGIDSDGVELATTMPRYELAQRDLNALLDYLETLGPVRSAGVDGDRIVFGFLQPLSGAEAERAGELRLFIDYMLGQMNLRRQVFGRKIALRAIPFAPEDAGAALRAVQSLDEQGEIFGLIGMLGAAQGNAIADYAASVDLPIIEPFHASPGPVGTSTFALRASLADQLDALTEELQRRVADHMPVAVIVDDTVEEATAGHAVAAIERLGRAARLLGPADAMDRAEVPLLLGDAKSLDAVAASSDEPGFPALFGLYDNLADVGGREAARLGVPVILVGTESPFDFSRQDRAGFRAISGMLSGQHPLDQARAMSALSLIEDVLLKIGREVDRTKFVTTLREDGPYTEPFTQGLDFAIPGAPGSTSTTLFVAMPDEQRLRPLGAEAAHSVSTRPRPRARSAAGAEPDRLSRTEPR